MITTWCHGPTMNLRELPMVDRASPVAIISGPKVIHISIHDPSIRNDSAILQAVAFGYLGGVEQVAFDVFFYGVFIVLFWASVVISIRRGFTNWAAALMFTATIFNFFLLTLNVGSTIADLVLYIRKVLMDDINNPLKDRVHAAGHAVHHTIVIQSWAGYLSVLISDLIVIWRAWVFFEHKRWVVTVPFIVWVGTVGVYLTYLGILSGPNGFEDIEDTNGSLLKSAIALSIATNVITTAMIGYRLWIHRVLIIKNLGLKARRNRVQNILILLAESGVVYCLLQILYMVVSLYEVQLFVGVLLQDSYYLFSAMYPTIVIIFVESQRSIADVYSLPTAELRAHHSSAIEHTHPGTVGRIPFATRRTSIDVRPIDHDNRRCPSDSERKSHNLIEGGIQLEVLTIGKDSN